MCAKRYTVGPQVYILTRPGSNDAKASLLRPRVLYSVRDGCRWRRLGAVRLPLGDLSPMLALPADLHVALAPDDDGHREGVLRGLLPPLLALVHPPFVEPDAALGEGGAGPVAGGAVAEGVHDDCAHGEGLLFAHFSIDAAVPEANALQASANPRDQILIRFQWP